MKKILLLVLILVTLQGCQLIRLGQFRDQLKEPQKALSFEQNIVTLKTPVLEPEDIMWLSGNSEPSTKESTGNSEYWVYKFKKINGTENLQMKLVFVNKKLTKLIYPHQLSALFETYLLDKALKAVSTITYQDENEPIQKANVTPFNKERLPKKRDVLNRLGSPSFTSANNTIEDFNYSYIIEGSNRKMVINFGFKNEDLKKVAGNLFGPYLSFLF